MNETAPVQKQDIERLRGELEDIAKLLNSILEEIKTIKRTRK